METNTNINMAAATSMDRLDYIIEAARRGVPITMEPAGSTGGDIVVTVYNKAGRLAESFHIAGIEEV